MINILKIINEEIDEIFDRNGIAKPIVIDDINNNGESVIIYRFSTKSNNEYEAHFIKSTIRNTILLNEIGSNYGYMLCDLLGKECDDSSIDVVDIAFTSTDNTNFEDTTNKHETIEVMNEVAEMIKLFVNTNSNVNIYIASGTEKIRSRMYITLFQNKFSNNFEIFHGETDKYNTPTLYFINKNLLQYQ